MNILRSVGYVNTVDLKLFRSKRGRAPHAEMRNEKLRDGWEVAWRLIYYMTMSCLGNVIYLIILIYVLQNLKFQFVKTGSTTDFTLGAKWQDYAPRMRQGNWYLLLSLSSWFWEYRTKLEKSVITLTFSINIKEPLFRLIHWSKIRLGTLKNLTISQSCFLLVQPWSG